MGLREIMEEDLGVILEDDIYGPAWLITVTDPAGTTPPEFKGYSNDISQLIDPDTGQAVSGRLASITLRISSLTAAGLDLPVGISNASSKPWIVQFNDINGNAFKFKVSQSNPDRTLGIVTSLLELYK